MKISRDESNPVQRIIEMFADFQICQREQKEAQNELEAFRKAMNFVQFVFFQLCSLFSVYFRSKSEKQERIIQQKNTEIERLKQQQTEHNSKLSELTLVFWVFIWLYGRFFRIRNKVYFISLYCRSKFDSQKHLIIQKDEEIELLKQQKSDDATKLTELK